MYIVNILSLILKFKYSLFAFRIPFKITIILVFVTRIVNYFYALNENCVLIYYLYFL